MLTRVSSAMPTTETSDDAFKRRMNSLISGGTEIRSACGSRMRRQMSPRGTERRRRLALTARQGVERAAQDFRLVGPRRQRQPANRCDQRRDIETVFGEEVIDEQQQHQQRHAAEHADIGAAEAFAPYLSRQARGAHRRANQEADRDAGERYGERRRRRPGQITEGVKDDSRMHRNEGSLLRAPQRVPSPRAGRGRGVSASGGDGAIIARPSPRLSRRPGERDDRRQIAGSGTVLGRSMVWPNHFFWIAATVPSPSSLTSAALIASSSVLSSSRPTQEK